MKKTISTAVLVALAVLGSSATAGAAGPQSYPMVCRGGGGMRVEWYGARAVTGRSTTPQVALQFAHAAAAASERQPGPGQCAWLDRPLNAKEASRMVIDGEAVYFQLQAGGRADVSFIPSEVNQVVRAALGGSVFYVHARTDGGVLAVTRVGP